MKITLSGKRVHGFIRDLFASSVESHHDWRKGLANKALGGYFYGEENLAQWQVAGPAERGLWLTGRLWNDAGIMPSSLCDRLDLPLGSSYAQGARRLRTKYRDWLQRKS